jgi:hypothetical protein
VSLEARGRKTRRSNRPDASPTFVASSRCRSAALAEAQTFLRSELLSHPVSAKAIERRASEAGISARTLKRAKQNLDVKSKKQSDGSWTWELPVKVAQEDQGPTAGSLGTVGPLGKDANATADDSAYLREGVQGGQGDQAPMCKHGYREGVGCDQSGPDYSQDLKQKNCS